MVTEISTERQQIEIEIAKFEQQLSSLLMGVESRQESRAELEAEIAQLRTKVEQLQQQLQQLLTPIDRVRTARHPDRPYTLDYAHLIFEDFQEIHGDRRFGDDLAIVCGMSTFQGEQVAIVGHQKANLKSRKTDDRKERNFGMPKPEGYRKALRFMKFAEKFRRPIFCFIDTPGAYPGIDAEERGQAEAIARNLIEMARIEVPILVTITGEGGSGGALAIGVGDKVYILENSIYSVISPEGCAAILWKDASKSDKAAQSMKITAPDLKNFNIVDEIIPEPKGGAHTDHKETAKFLAQHLKQGLEEVRKLSIKDMLEKRYNKFRQMGAYTNMV
ncbi:MAG: acetyl-CoA carboxylase carboxyltransferase subunit alpha [Blastocatellia bacterium]|nr:acetyl-CoA carboxylase carboxyltransferase subunit alpha [Blastocatellia bacterium]